MEIGEGAQFLDPCAPQKLMHLRETLSAPFFFSSFLFMTCQSDLEKQGGEEFMGLRLGRRRRRERERERATTPSKSTRGNSTSPLPNQRISNQQSWYAKWKLSWNIYNYAQFIHLFASLAPIYMLSRCLSTKFLHLSSVRSLLRVRCWLGLLLLLDWLVPATKAPESLSGH